MTPPHTQPTRQTTKPQVNPAQQPPRAGSSQPHHSETKRQPESRENQHQAAQDTDRPSTNQPQGNQKATAAKRGSTQVRTRPKPKPWRMRLKTPRNPPTFKPFFVLFGLVWFGLVVSGLVGGVCFPQVLGSVIRVPLLLFWVVFSGSAVCVVWIDVCGPPSFLSSPSPPLRLRLPTPPSGSP